MPSAIARRLIPLFAVASAVAVAACTGDLVDLDSVDQGSSSGTTFVATIERDLDGMGCSGGGACHGGGSAPMRLTANARVTPALIGNWMEVRSRASSGEMSLLLRKTLQTSGVTHTGTRPFSSTSDPTYQRWLGWISAGAPFGPGLPDGGIPPDDLTTSDADTDASTD